MFGFIVTPRNNSSNRSHVVLFSYSKWFTHSSWGSDLIKIKLSGYLLVRTNSSFCNRFPGSRDVLWHSSPDSDYHKDVRLASLMSKASGVSLSLPTFCSLSCCIFLSLSLPLAIFLGLFLFFFVPLSHAPDDAGWITLPHNSVEWSVLFFLHKYTFTVYYVLFFV